MDNRRTRIYRGCKYIVMMLEMNKTSSDNYKTGLKRLAGLMEREADDLPEDEPTQGEIETLFGGKMEEG